MASALRWPRTWPFSPTQQWSTPSLCSRWTVQDVLAHMTALAKVTPTSFVPKLVGSGFSLGRMQAKDVATEKGASGAETLAHFEGVLASKRPPGLRRSYPTRAVVQAADFYKGSNLFLGTKRRITGVMLRATDVDWSHGSGPEVAGPILAILMAMTGREAALDDLSEAGCRDSAGARVDLDRVDCSRVR